MVSGGGGCPGPAVLGAVEEDPTLALDVVTLLPLLEEEDIARGNPRSPGTATPEHVDVLPGGKNPRDIVTRPVFSSLIGRDVQCSWYRWFQQSYAINKPARDLCLLHAGYLWHKDSRFPRFLDL